MPRKHITYLPTDKVSAREFLHWKYETPYEIYNYDPANFERDLAYHLDPNNNIQSMYRAGELIGYCSFGKDAQVPGGDYSESALDIGLMIKPDLTGQGLGASFVADVIRQAVKTRQPEKLRVTILASNARAIRVWEKNGFMPAQTFTRQRDRREFSILTKDV